MPASVRALAGDSTMTRSWLPLRDRRGAAFAAVLPFAAFVVARLAGGGDFLAVDGRRGRGVCSFLGWHQVRLWFLSGGGLVSDRTLHGLDEAHRRLPGAPCPSTPAGPMRRTLPHIGRPLARCTSSICIGWLESTFSSAASVGSAIVTSRSSSCWRGHGQVQLFEYIFGARYQLCFAFRMSLLAPRCAGE